MVTVPAPTPVTAPVELLTVATAVFALLHVPPATELNNEVTEPTQTVAVPVMLAGAGLTVTDFIEGVAEHGPV